MHNDMNVNTRCTSATHHTCPLQFRSRKTVAVDFEIGLMAETLGALAADNDLAYTSLSKYDAGHLMDNDSDSFIHCHSLLLQWISTSYKN